MPYAVQHSHPVRRDIADALDIFVAFPLLWLPKPASALGSGQWQLQVRTATSHQLEIDCAIGAPGAHGSRAIRAMTWRLTPRGTHPRIARPYPRLTGHLILRATPENSPEVMLVGTFTGAAAAVGLRRFADHAAKCFVQDVAAQLGQAALPPGTPRHRSDPSRAHTRALSVQAPSSQTSATDPPYEPPMP
ncbi:MAG TPA: hypothetical protein VMM13_17325 [Euzebya sp.]|nr:hypothetical protein [Euzebya sp.]